jgi:hypothetical protein
VLIATQRRANAKVTRMGFFMVLSKKKLCGGGYWPHSQR